MIFNVLSAQDYELPEMDYYDMKIHYWDDTITANQMKKWDNGNTQVEYVDLNDSTKLRKEYSRDGGLKLTAEVFQVFCSDTFVTFDPETYKETFEVIEAIRDIPHGRYFEYYSKRLGFTEPRTKGSYQYGYKYGEWLAKTSPLGEVIVANYNSQGKLEGIYTEYHFNPKKQVKLQGEYKVFKMKRWYKDGKTKKLKSDEYYSSRRVGKWKLYNELGELIETVKYKPRKR